MAAVAAKFEELRYIDESPARLSLQELGAVLSAASARIGQTAHLLAPKGDK